MTIVIVVLLMMLLRCCCVCCCSSAANDARARLNYADQRARDKQGAATAVAVCCTAGRGTSLVWFAVNRSGCRVTDSTTSIGFVPCPPPNDVVYPHRAPETGKVGFPFALPERSPLASQLQQSHPPASYSIYLVLAYRRQHTGTSNSGQSLYSSVD